MNRGEADGCGGVAADGFGEDVRRGDAAQFAADACGLFDVGDCPEIAQARKAARGGRRFARSMVSSPAIFRSCLGVRVRLRGQKRVPRPPARRTAQAGSSRGLLHGCVPMRSWMHQARPGGFADALIGEFAREFVKVRGT